MFFVEPVHNVIGHVSDFNDCFAQLSAANPGVQARAWKYALDSFYSKVDTDCVHRALALAISNGIGRVARRNFLPFRDFQLDRIVTSRDVVTHH